MGDVLYDIPLQEVELNNLNNQTDSTSLTSPEDSIELIEKLELGIFPSSESTSNDQAILITQVDKDPVVSVVLTEPTGTSRILIKGSSIDKSEQRCHCHIL